MKQRATWVADAQLRLKNNSAALEAFCAKLILIAATFFI